MSNDDQKVYISYAWGGESERIANELDDDLHASGINVIRDKRDLRYKGSISDFMQQIGQGHAIIVVISDKYLKSPNCMYELVQIANNRDIHNRIFPIVLGDADIYNPKNRIKYIKHWEDELKELDEAMKSVSSANLQGLRNEIDIYDEIRDNISNLTFLLKDLNTLTPEMHEGSHFASLVSAIKERQENTNRETEKTNTATTELTEELLKSALRKLGHPPKIYHRNDLEKEILDNVLGNEHPVTFIHGLPGSGKTILLGEVAKKIHQTYPNIFTLKFAGVSTAEPAYFIEELNEFLTRLNFGMDPNSLTNQDWRRSLESLSKQLSRVNQFILLLDDVDQAPPGLIDSLLDLLPQAKIVMTAQSRVIPKTKGQFIIAPPLQEREAMEFLNVFGAPPEGWDENLNWLLRIPKKIKENPQRLKLLIVNLRDVPLDVLLDDGIDDLSQHPSMLIHTLIQGLTDDALRVLSLIVLLEGLDLSPSLKTLNIAHPKGLGKNLTLLLGKSLIYRQGDSYLIPSLVRESAVEKIPKIISDETVNQVGQAIQAVSSILQKQRDQPVKLAPIIANFFLHMSELEYYDQIINLATEELIETMNRQGFWKEYRLILRISFKAAKLRNNLPALASMGFRIVRKSFQIRDMQSSRQALSELENMLEAAPNSQISAELLSHRALFTELDGDSQGALDQLQQSFQIYEGLKNKESMSTIQNLMGNIYLRQMDIIKARQSYQSALPQDTDEQNLSKQLLEVKTNIAVCDFIEKKLDNAQTSLRDIIKRCKETGFLAGLPRAYYFLALILDLEDQDEEALRYAELASELALKSEPSIARGAQVLVWKIKDRNSRDSEV